MTIINLVRAYHYLAGVLMNQQHDPFCGRCSAWNNTLDNIRESLSLFEQTHAAELKALPPEATALLTETRNRIAALKNISEPAGQKKAGNCKMPEGVCFVKYSKTILEKV